MGLFFSKRRTDGKQVTGGDPMNYIMPYVMRSRTESQVFASYPIRLEAIDEFIRQNRRAGRRVTFFNILVAALLKTIVERPRLNRFIAGRRIYEHNHFEVLYVVKEALTEAGNESVACVRFAPEDTVYDVAAKMAEQTGKIKNGVLKEDDQFIRWLLRAPRWLIRTIFAFYRWLDFHGVAPKAAIESFPFYSSIFVSHLGTIGGNAAFHHLYEMGTTSIFITIGRSEERPQRGEDGSIDWIKEINLAINVDERICDGYYLVKSLRLFERYMNDPWLLEFPGINIDLRMTPQYQEFRQRQEMEKKSSRERRKERLRAEIRETLREEELEELLAEKRAGSGKSGGSASEAARDRAGGCDVGAEGGRATEDEP